MRNAVSVFLGILLAVHASPSGAQQLSRLSGTIVDATGGAVPGVAVGLIGPENRLARTDAEGRFDFQNLASGQYELSAEREGFGRERRMFRLTPGQDMELCLTLTVVLVEQTIVTAARTGDADVQTTPIAVSAIAGDDAFRMGVHSVSDMGGIAPSVTFSQNTDFGQLTIRGIGTNAIFAGSDPSSAVYLDGVYLARPAMLFLQIPDLERIEVIRGPQGTLYGRNAVGGAINLITTPPTNDAAGSIALTLGGDHTARIDARAGGPLVPGRVMAGGAIVRTVRDGFVTDLDHPGHPLGGDDLTAARGQLRVLFTPRLDLMVASDFSFQNPTPLTFSKVLAVKPGFQIDNPVDLHQVRMSTEAWSRNQQTGQAARLTFSPSPETTLTSLSSFRTLEHEFLVDADITELDLLTSNIHEMQHQLSEEISISHHQPRARWIGGVFLFSEDDLQPAVVGLKAQRLENRYTPRVAASSAAAFGQATATLTPRVDVTAGLRYSREEKRIESSGQLIPVDPPETPLAGSTYAFADTLAQSAWTPKFAVDLHAGRGTLLYASATRGFKSGGFNATSTAAGRGYAPEWAWSYEAGLKTTVAGGRGRLALAAFDTSYTNLQVQTAIQPGVLDISNAASAMIRGIELESTVRPARSIELGGHVSWLDARYDRYIAAVPGGGTSDVAGHRLTNAPEASGRLWVEWQRELGRRMRLSLRSDLTAQSTVYFTPFNDDIQRQQAYGLIGMSAELGPRSGRWSITAYARNAANQDYITATFSASPAAFGGRPGEPREAGVTLSVRR